MFTCQIDMFCKVWVWMNVCMYIRRYSKVKQYIYKAKTNCTERQPEATLRDSYFSFRLWWPRWVMVAPYSVLSKGWLYKIVLGEWRVRLGEKGRGEKNREVWEEDREGKGRLGLWKESYEKEESKVSEGRKGKGKLKEEKVEMRKEAK